jgi:succinyl-diaminopimelate desuccinylase
MIDRSSALREIVKLTQDLVRIKSINPPGDELPAAVFLAERLRSFGLEADFVDIGNNRGNVVATIKGSDESAPAFMFNGHLDVVPAGEASAWERDPFCGDIIDGKVFGRGASDMKGGVAAMSVAVALLLASGKRFKGDIVLTAVSGEESDSIGAKHYVGHNSVEKVGAVVIPESTGLDLVVAEKGTIWLEFTTHGKTAHSTQPHIGINALEHMISLLTLGKEAWDKVPYAKDPYLSPPTINIATISAGVKTNSIPDRCVATVDLRPVPSQNREEILAKMQGVMDRLAREIPNFKAEMKVINERMPVATPVDAKLIRVASALGPPVIGRGLGFFGVNFFTDAAVFATKKQIPTLIMGPGEYDLRNNIYLGHQPNEFVKIENLDKAARFYYELVNAYHQ